MKRYIITPFIILAAFCFINCYSETFASPVKIASIQYHAVPFDKSANISNLKILIKEAAVKGAKLIVLPEMCTTGLTISGPLQAQALAETIPGPTTNMFALLAKEYSVYIVLGLPESNLKNNKYYNTQIIIDNNGCVIGKYRKKHLSVASHPHRLAHKAHLRLRCRRADLEKLRHVANLVARPVGVLEVPFAEWRPSR